jgi:hypothetical protein
MIIRCIRLLNDTLLQIMVFRNRVSTHKRVNHAEKGIEFHLFIYSFIYLFIYSFIHSFIHCTQGFSHDLVQQDYIRVRVITLWLNRFHMIESVWEELMVETLRFQSKPYSPRPGFDMIGRLFLSDTTTMRWPSKARPLCETANKFQFIFETSILWLLFIVL